MLIKIGVYIVVLLTSIPVSLLLAWLCKDEMVKDRKWFTIALCSFIFFLILTLFFYIEKAVILCLVYMILVTIVFICLSYKRVVK